MNTTISPSILSCDFLNIEAELKQLERAKDIWIHLDIMDGHFVPNLTFGHEIIKKISTKSTHKLDAHLMVTNPQFYIETLKDCNLHNITFHYEAEKDPLALIEKAKTYYPSVGISIKPNTSLSALSDEVFKEIDLLLIMSVEPGFGGQKFLASSLDKVEKANQKRSQINSNLIIQVDGGINSQTAKETLQRGANNLVAGSYIFKSDDYNKQIESLRA